MTRAAKNTLTNLLVDVGRACIVAHDKMVRGFQSKRVQCDEIWSFVGEKQKNVPDSKEQVWGDAWTAIDADSKLIVSYLIQQRGPKWAKAFMEDKIVLKDPTTKDRQSLDLSVRAVHCSSAGIGDYNPGINITLQFGVGYSWWTH